MNQARQTETPRYLDAGHVLRDRYEIAREIGRGGYSVVYVARDRELRTDVAVKLLVPPPALAAMARERMRREAIAARGLAHPNIVSLHDFLEEGPWSFLVMEYVDGPDLRERVDTGESLSTVEAVLVGTDIAAALDAAHGQGILHRDVKPQNVLLDADGRARLTDFGSARIESQATVTATGGIVGTVAYAAPEEIAGLRADSRSDVYSLGLTLYFALTGELPGGPSPHLPPAQAEGGHHPRSVRSDVPLWLDEVIACATAATPGRRFPTAGSMRDALLAGSANPGASVPAFRYSDLGFACPLCGTDDEFDLGVCPGCADGSSTADTLLFVKAPPDRRERADLGDRLANRVGREARREALQDLLSGRRPLALLPASSAAAAISRLCGQSIPVQAEPAREAWRRVPRTFSATLVAVIVAGLMAGWLAAPEMWIATPLFVGLLVLLAVRRVRTPILRRSRKTTLHLPSSAEDGVKNSLASLHPGPARRLLKDVIRMASGVFVQQEADPGTGDLEAALGGLLERSCAVAMDLGHLDESLAILEQLDDRSSGEGGADWVESVTRARRARDGLTQTLLEAISALGRTRIAIAAGQSASEGLTAFSAELESRATAQAEARREVEALVR